jgi:hypothetical protein
MPKCSTWNICFQRFREFFGCEFGVFSWVLSGFFDVCAHVCVRGVHVG